jgi:Glyoxalase-like domain
MPRRFDHCVLCVFDLERAAQTFVALGFTLTPIGQLPFGVRNRVALFGGVFLELLAVADPAAVPPHAPGQFSFGAHNQAFLAEGEGMSMLAWHSSDAHGDARRFNADGHRVQNCEGLHRSGC